MRILCFLIFFCVLNLSSQTIKNKKQDTIQTRITDLASRIKSKQNLIDPFDTFQLKADLLDSLFFSTSGYGEHEFTLAMQEAQGFQSLPLTTKINELNEVKVTAFKNDFNIEKFNEDFQMMLTYDRDKRPYLYSKTSMQPDLIKIIGLVYEKFFKKKEIARSKTMKYEDFQQLFESDSLINSEFLKDELHIPLELKNLYIDYLDSQSWDARLLEEENRLDLIEKLYESSISYLKRVEPDAK